jgi:IS4 transposase
MCCAGALLVRCQATLWLCSPDLMLVIHMIPCEDGHAQERSLTSQILDKVVANEVWIADRNFCTEPVVSGVVDRQAYYVIRQHAGMKVLSAGTLRRRGRTETGEVYEQSVTLAKSDGTKMKARRIVLRLDKPTRDGAGEIAVLTNLSAEVANAVAVAELYRNRWTLETMFLSLTQMLQGEIAALGYPGAALLGFGVALASYNVLSTVQAALRAVWPASRRSLPRWRRPSMRLGWRPGRFWLLSCKVDACGPFRSRLTVGAGGN